MLATYENQLMEDDTVPEAGRALDSKRQELAVSVGTLGLGSLSLLVLPPQHLWTDKGPETPRATAASFSRFGMPAGCQTGICQWRPLARIPAAHRV